MPLGVGKIGRVGAGGEAIVVKDFAGDLSSRLRYQWASHQHVRGLNARPIKFKEEMLGVLVMFTCIPTRDEEPIWLRIFADAIAGAIVNARAFEEIERSRAHLEAENTYLQEEVREARAYGDIIGLHSSVRRLLKKIEMVASTDASVLVLGESSAGQELVARELQNATERALILAQNWALQFDLPGIDFAAPPPPAPPPIRNGSKPPILTESELREKERQNVLAALAKADWRIHGQGGAAELFGLKPTTLISRIKKMGLKRPI